MTVQLASTAAITYWSIQGVSSGLKLVTLGHVMDLPLVNKLRKTLCNTPYEPSHEKTNKMPCVPCEDSRSAWASVQSDQSFRCPHEETSSTWLPTESTVKTDQTGWMPRLI